MTIHFLICEEFKLNPYSIIPKPLPRCYSQESLEELLNLVVIKLKPARNQNKQINLFLFMILTLYPLSSMRFISGSVLYQEPNGSGELPVIVKE